MSVSKLTSDVPEEYDSYDRKACFYLFTKPLNYIIIGESDQHEVHHWALVAIFTDKSVRTMEGNDVNGVLTPSFIKELPPNSRDGHPEKWYPLLQMKTSPKKLQTITIANRLNGKEYSASDNNCQNWVEACASAINPNLSKMLANYGKNGEIRLEERTVFSSWVSSKSLKKSIRRQLLEHPMICSCRFL